MGSGDYIDHPRGRVVWNCTDDHAIIYIDRCINQPEVLAKIKEAFDLQAYVVRSDEHYRCRRRIDDLKSR